MTRLPTIAALYAIHAVSWVAIRVLDRCAHAARKMTQHYCSYSDNQRAEESQRGAFVVGITCDSCAGKGGFGEWPCDNCGGDRVNEYVTLAELAREMRHGT